MSFSASVDHRLADGADGASFLVYIKRLLENPTLLALCSHLGSKASAEEAVPCNLSSHL
jgi:hypothetical protein